MSCGFGAVVLLFMISKHATTRLEQPHVDYAGEVARLEQQVGDAGARIEQLDALRAGRGPELAAAREAARAAREALAETQATAPAAGGGADEIAALRASITKLEAEKQRLLAQPEEKSRYVRAFTGEGNREYLTGVQQGGRRILVLLDTSSSMLDASPVEAIRKHVVQGLDGFRVIAGAAELGTILYFPDNGETHHSTGVEWPFVVIAGRNTKLNIGGKYIRLPNYGEQGHKTLGNWYTTLLNAYGNPVKHYGDPDPGLGRFGIDQTGAIKQFLA